MDKEAKSHRKSQAGPNSAKNKAAAKEARRKGKADGGNSAADDGAKPARRIGTKENNPKAFTFKSGRRAEKQQRRTRDLDQQKLHVPLVDRTPLEAPPIVVAVVGPPGVGKSTLIRSLVKRYTRYSVQEPLGPITVVSGKKRRLTIIECANDLNSMIDVAKIADLVLLLIDASFGFEMETFEFLNVLQVHGFPKVMGVLTHLDKFKDNKALRKRKKDLKQRFWTEIYAGAKLFYLSGVVNGRYRKTEIMNLSRFISVMKFRPLIWRNAHPYVVCDRLEDMTDPVVVKANPKSDRTVTLYGYVRGTNLRPSMKVHIPGCGDTRLTSVTVLPDPCPLPEKVRKTLSEKQRVIHAPMSDVGGVRYDKDAVYINVPGIYSKDSENSGQRTEGESMLLELQDVENTLEEKMKMTGMRLFEGSAMLGADALDGEDDGDSNDGSDLEGEGSSDEELSDDEDDDEEEESGKEDAPRPDSRNRRAWPAGGSGSKASKGQSNLVFDDDEAEDEEEGDYDGMENGAGDFEGSDDEEEDEEDEENELLRWKDDIKGKAARAHASNRRVDYMALVYGNKDHAANQANDVSDSESDHDELLRKVEKPERAEARNVLVDSCRPNLPAEVLSKWNDDDVLDSLRYRFITGSTDGPAPENGDDDEILDGDFEDLENAAPGGNTSAGGDEADEGDDLLDKKEALKRKFDAMYDEEDEDGKGDESLYERTKAEMEKQAAINRAEFADADPSVRYQLEGFSPGTYVRIVLEDVPYEFSAHFSPKYPVLVGGLLPTEDTFGYVQVRLKKHRWHPKILKNHDPLIFSVGWRRFQTIPMFHIIENGQRHRMLKYTPEHMHCMATFYGPTAPPNTGFCAFKSLSGTQSSFRISATGTIVDIDQGVEVVKKLKLVGHPYKVFKNTAFIKDMFTSSLEVAKFEGASLRTVSGIRGQIKKHLSKPEGCFRATFEDKILMSDIVFLRAWYPVKPKPFYNPVTNLLLSPNETWQGMRLTGEIRRDRNVPLDIKNDSLYKPIERPVRHFNPLQIPRKIESALPFASKPKQLAKQKKPTLDQRRAVVMEPHEKKVYTLLQQLNTIRNDKAKRREETAQKKRGEYLKRKAAEEEITSEKRKRRRKEELRSKGMKEKRAA